MNDDGLHLHLSWLIKTGSISTVIFKCSYCRDDNKSKWIVIMEENKEHHRQGSTTHVWVFHVLWYEDIATTQTNMVRWSARYLGDKIRRLTDSIASSTLPLTRKVALISLNRCFIDVFMIYHFYLDQQLLLNCYSRVSAVYLVPDATVFSPKVV